MWWVVGAAVLVAAVYLFRIIQRAKLSAGLSRVVAGHIRTSQMGFAAFNERLQTMFWTDDYCVGYVFGFSGGLCALLAPKFSTTERGYVLLNALEIAEPEQFNVLKAYVLEIAGAGDPDFGKGCDDAFNVVVLGNGTPSERMLADPDIQSAMRDAPLFSKMSRDMGITSGARPHQFVSASAALHSFYMKKRAEFVRGWAGIS